MRTHPLATAFSAATLCLAASAPVVAQPNHSSCFFTNQWNGWKAADDRTVYLNVSINTIYRLDMASSCPELLWPDVHLVSRDQEGSGSICGPLDFDLKVSTDHGPSTPCIVAKMTRLTPEEAAAIPKKFRP